MRFNQLDCCVENNIRQTNGKLAFHKGAALEDPKGLFNASPEGNVRRAIDIHEGRQVDATAFKALTRAAVAHFLLIGRGILSRRCAVPPGGFQMSISFDDVGSDLRRIVITGRLDVPGTDSIAARLEELVAAPKKGVVVDLTSLRFLASIGISALITSAKAIKQRGGKMVLVVEPGSSVAMSLEATGVDELIPVFEGATEAERAAVA